MCNIYICFVTENMKKTFPEYPIIVEITIFFFFWNQNKFSYKFPTSSPIIRDILCDRMPPCVRSSRSRDPNVAMVQEKTGLGKVEQNRSHTLPWCTKVNDRLISFIHENLSWCIVERKSHRNELKKIFEHKGISGEMTIEQESESNTN